jgi:hypothetical protein
MSSSLQIGLWKQENCLVQDAFSCDYLFPAHIILIGGNGLIGGFAVAALQQQEHAAGGVSPRHDGRARWR